MPPQRRLAAILAADVVGYSRLMGQDEAGTLTRLKAHWSGQLHPALKRHGGRVVKLMGDGALAEFSSAVSALHAAIEFQQSVEDAGSTVPTQERIAFRVGLHLGDVIVDEDDLYGEGVNIAARLEGQATSGGIVVSASLRHEALGKVDAAFEDLGILPLKNIERAVQGYAVTWDPPKWSARSTPTPPSALESRPGSTPPDDRSPPTIAVMPLSALDADPRLGFLADALTEDLITLLARMPGFLVISRHSTSHLRNTPGGASEVAEKLGVRYVVEGSLRPTAGGVRISARLSDASTGAILWSEQLGSQAEGGIDVQDEIARSVISHIEPALTRAEIAVIRRLRPDNVDAWGHYRQALGATALEGWTHSTLGRARSHLRQAIEIDPGFSLARSYLGLITALGLNSGVLPDDVTLRDEALKAAEEAAEMDPEHSEVLGYSGCTMADLGQVTRGLELLQLAIELNPCNAQAQVAQGASLAIGRDADLEAAIAQIRHGMRLSPIDRRLGFWGWALALNLMRQGKVQEALTEAKAAGRRDPKLFLSRVVEALALVQLNDHEGAKAALATARRLYPDLSPSIIGRSCGRRAQAALAPMFDQG